MVKLKWGMEYKGYLVSVDGYMNLQVSWFIDINKHFVVDLPCSTFKICLLEIFFVIIMKYFIFKHCDCIPKCLSIIYFMIMTIKTNSLSIKSGLVYFGFCCANKFQDPFWLSFIYEFSFEITTDFYLKHRQTGLKFLCDHFCLFMLKHDK